MVLDVYVPLTLMTGDVAQSRGTVSCAVPGNDNGGIECLVG